MTLLLIQITVVLLTALGCGWIAHRLGQARVVGEIAGGILLGPSVFGRIAPHTLTALFPTESFATFDVLSNLGLILFLFLIGTSLDLEHLRRQRRTAALASGISMVLPFTLAVLAAPWLRSRFGVAGVGRLPFTLFLGISLSITAFPVLARILEERGMQATPVGVTALLCAAVDDVCAWLLLAVAMMLLLTGAGTTPVVYRLLGLAAYLAVMGFGVRLLGAWLGRRLVGRALSQTMLALMLAVVFASAAATEAIGIHPLFGAFLAGMCFPRIPAWQNAVRVRLETIVSSLLLPIFFALTGMRTRLDLLTGGRVWLWTGVVLVLAVAGKMGGAVLAARLTGQSWRAAWALGALLNTRGLVELIVLNIAYNAHVFSPTLFTMLVVMALATTMMTTPALNALSRGDLVPQG